MRFNTLEILWIFHILWNCEYFSFAAASEPYCIRSVEEITGYKEVIKTREIIKTRKRFFKVITDKTLEEYTDLEPIMGKKIVHECCAGYSKSKLDLCEPVCKEGCPQNSECSEPEICKCKQGYFSVTSTVNGKHQCEPICDTACPEHSVCVGHNQCACKKGYHITTTEFCKPYCASGCPFNGNCIAPDVCECKSGYKSEKGSCLATCNLGNGCQNGVCIDNDQCKCHAGFELNNETQICEMQLDGNGFTESSSDVSDITEKEKDKFEMETDINTSKEDVDPEQVFQESFDSTTFGYTVENSLCPEDFIFYEGECKPTKFASEVDCHIQPCADEHAVCQENGTCTCIDSYIWSRSHDALDQLMLPDHPAGRRKCLTLSEYNATMAKKITYYVTPETDGTLSWSEIFYIVFGVLILVAALVYLGVKLLFTKKGDMDVYDKNLSCAYDNRCSLDAEKSVI